MINLQVFLDELFQSLGRSLYFFYGAPEEINAIDWSIWIPKFLAGLTICVLLITLFWLIYRGALLSMRRLSKRFHVKSQSQGRIAKGFKYLWYLASAIVVASQVGIDSATIKSSVNAVFIGAIFFGLWIAMDRVIESTFKNNDLNASIMQLSKNVVSVLLVVFAIAALMKQFGFDLVSIVAGLGIVGLAVGFAAQSTLADFIAGITILIEQPFKIGDWVRINEKEGMVERIALRTTRIRTRDNVSIVIPNSTVAAAEVTNLTARHLVRFKASFGIAYEEHVDEARQVILKAIESTEFVLKTPAPMIMVDELADSGVNLYLLFWLLPANIDKQPKITAALLETIHESLVAADIEIPYPHVQLLTNKP